MGGIRQAPYRTGQRKRKRSAGSNRKLTGPEIWERIWSNAIYYLGLSTDQLLALTLHEYYVLMDRVEEDEKFQRHMAGTVAAAVANFGYRETKQPLAPMDFFEEREEPPRRRITAKQRFEASERSRMAMLSIGARVGIVETVQ